MTNITQNREVYYLRAVHCCTSIISIFCLGTRGWRSDVSVLDYTCSMPHFGLHPALIQAYNGGFGAFTPFTSPLAAGWIVTPFTPGSLKDHPFVYMMFAALTMCCSPSGPVQPVPARAASGSGEAMHPREGRGHRSQRCVSLVRSVKHTNIKGTKYQRPWRGPSWCTPTIAASCPAKA